MFDLSYRPGVGDRVLADGEAATVIGVDAATALVEFADDTCSVVEIAGLAVLAEGEDDAL